MTKSISKDRERRYESPNAFAEDIERYLSHEPVLATPPSVGYRLWKFARRNRTLLGVAVSIGAILVTATLVSSLMASRAIHAERETAKSLIEVKKERDEKENQRALAVIATDAERQAKDREIAEREISDAVANYVVETFRRPDPTVDGRKITMAQSLERSLKSLQVQFEDNPAIKAKLLVAIGRSYIGLGLPLEAIEPLQQAIQLRSKFFGEDQGETLSAQFELGLAYRNARKFDEATQLLEAVMNHEIATKGEKARDTLRAMHALGNLYADANSEKARPLLNKSFELWKEVFGPEYPETVKAMLAFAVELAKSGEHDQAKPLFDEGLPRMRELYGSNHPDTIIFMSSRAQFHIAAGEWDVGIPLLEEVVQAMESTLGPEHRNTLSMIKTLAQIYDRQERREESRPLYLRLQKSAFFNEQVKMARERYEKALAEEGTSDQHHTSLLAKRDMAQVLLWQGRFEDAEEALSQVLLGMKDRTNDDPIMKYTSQLLFEVGKGLGRPELRTHWLIELEKSRYPQASERVAGLTNLARGFLKESKLLDAEIVAHRCLQSHPETMEQWTGAHLQCLLGAIATKQAALLIESDRIASKSKLDEAESLLEKGFAGMQLRADTTPSYKIAWTETINCLADFYTTRAAPGDSENAARYRAMLPISE